MGEKAVYLGGSLPSPAALGKGPLSQLEIVATVSHGVEAEGRAALLRALQLLAQGKATVLVADSPRRLATSVTGFLAVLGWLEEAGCRLLLLEPLLDGGSAEGRAAFSLLRELATAGAKGFSGGRKRGRPGLAQVAPDLYRHIRALAEAGLKPRQIADRLNAEGVSTPRGGRWWRPSSVQAALGYRRPPRELKGAPPPPPPPHRHPPAPPAPPHPPGGRP